MYKGPIVDPRVKIRASKQLLEALYEHREHLTEIPENINKALKAQGFKINIKIEVPTEKLPTKMPRIDTKLLLKLREEMGEVELSDKIPMTEEEEKKEISEPLYLKDLIWLNSTFKKLRELKVAELYLHQFLADCEIQLPENSVIERNPELEKRCQLLREQQENLAYRRMTKGVDATIKHCPEDSIAYQMKSLNRQIIAVFQFVVSVITGFVFGFIGVPLLVGNMEFGSRIMLGITCSIVIAVAEFYFLAKKLAEYDNPTKTLKKQMNPMTKKVESKPHKD